MPTGDVSKKEITRDWLIILAISTAGFLLRMFQLGKKSISFDEFYSVTIASEKSFGKMITLFTSTEVHPPLYHFLLHFWLTLGKSELILRLPSVVFGTLIVIATYCLGKVLFNKKVGAIAAFITAISPFQVVHSQEVRMYTMVTLLVVLSFIFLLFAMNKGGVRYWIGYVMTIVLAMYTHYYAILILAAQNVFFVVGRSPEPCGSGRGKTRGSITKWLLVQLSVALLYLPWLFVLLKVFLKVQRRFWIPTGALPLEVAYTFKWLAAGPLSIYDMPVGAVAIVLALIVFGFAFIRGIASGGDNPQALRLLLCWLFVPIGLAVLLSFKQSIYQSRYFILCSPAFYLLAANGVATLKNNWFRWATVLLVSVLSCLTLFNWYFNPSYARRPNARKAVGFVQENMKPGDIIVHNDIGNYLPFKFYYDADLQQKVYLIEEHPLTELQGGRFVPQDKKITSISSLDVCPKRIWLVISTSYVGWRQGPNPDIAASHFMGRAFAKTSERQFDSVKVFLYVSPKQSRNGKK